jgi:NAD(P)-dependent dehydrogenase (short-subunit alcohol dehydrogenase family)
MNARLKDRVAVITGAARGQGRAHAVRLAGEGADIIAVDLAGKLPSCAPYPSSTPEDLAETARLVEATGRRVLTTAVDTRDLDGMRKAVDDGVAALGRLDVIVANAGISAPAAWNEIAPEAFRDVMDVNVTGTWNTVMAGAQHIIDGGRGGSIILIGSAAGIKLQPFMIHYTASKHAVTGMARAFAAELGKHSIRVNRRAPRSGDHRDGFAGDGCRDRQGGRSPRQPGPDADADTVSAELGRPTRGHRRCGVLAGQ